MKLSVEAILDVAQRIEQNAAVYYGKAAERFPEFADVMGQLQVMEVQHEQKFMKMQNNLEEEFRSKMPADPFGELESYIQAFADTSGGEGRPAEPAKWDGSESVQDMLARSVELETESVKFYESIGKALVGASGAEHLAEIIKEELDHVEILKRLLATHAG
ncbi:MAG: hypothetical protein HN368_15920 [Spirochaetales bacterium]|jgi:rubrerythrin|nr:hypothetical protein [Spirochaetales bacterium]